MRLVSKVWLFQAFLIIKWEHACACQTSVDISCCNSVSAPCWDKQRGTVATSPQQTFYQSISFKKRGKNRSLSPSSYLYSVWDYNVTSFCLFIIHFMMNFTLIKLPGFSIIAVCLKLRIQSAGSYCILYSQSLRKFSVCTWFLFYMFIWKTQLILDLTETCSSCGLNFKASN